MVIFAIIIKEIEDSTMLILVLVEGSLTINLVKLLQGQVPKRKAAYIQLADC